MSETSGVLTIEYAGYLADIINGVTHRKRLVWYPFGSDSADNPAEMVMRAFTYDGGNLYPHDKDIREAYVWLSGMFERWINVNDIVMALVNLNTGGLFGDDKPMAKIDKS